MSDPNVQNFKVTQGDTKLINGSVVAPIGSTLDGSTINWACWNQEFGVPKGASLLSKVLAGAGSAMTFSFTLLDTDTAQLSPGNYYHECWILDSQGNYKTIFAGMLTVPTVRYTGA